MIGPQLPISQEMHQIKYRSEGEDFKSAMVRIANHLKDDEDHFHKIKPILYNQKFLPGGRVQAAAGAPKVVTAFNCFVMGTIPDSMAGIMQIAAEAAETMRLGGGVGYDFSTLRPRGSLIRSLDSKSSGPISFMEVFDALCRCIVSAGHRRGAQMGCLRVDHPDIEEFIAAKSNIDKLTNFNISVLITDAFMDAVKKRQKFDLTFNGIVYKTIDAYSLWEKILRNTWDWAEPGVLFIDTINKKNNLWYVETIAATNPCGEQPLPPNGACLLGSYNSVKYLVDGKFDYEMLKRDIHVTTSMMNNIIDRTTYPLKQQEEEAKSKRRMGLGLTGLANAIEAIIGPSYGTDDYIEEQEKIFKVLRDETYRASINIAKEKGSFPFYDRDKYLQSNFIRTLPDDIQQDIYTYGIANSHLLSIAPTGTISLTADNVSSGIEPVFSHWYDRTIRDFDGAKVERIEDYGYRVFGVKGRTANEISVFDHVKVLVSASKYVDSACSKTCNVGDNVTWSEFKQVYQLAYEGGASGCTTFRASGKRIGILTASTSEDVVEGAACYIDPMTGKKTCDT